MEHDPLERIWTELKNNEHQVFIIDKAIAEFQKESERHARS